MKFTRDDTKSIKGIAILLMLCHHLFAFPFRINYEYISLFKYFNKPISEIIGQYGKICVYIFLFLGGYGICKKYVKDDFKFIRTKLLSLYKSYWKVFFIVVPISLALGVSRISIRIDYLLMNFLGMDITYNEEWWFLTPYILLIIISPLLIKLIKKINLNVIYSILLVILINSFIVYIYPELFNFNIFKIYNYSLIHKNISDMIQCLPVFMFGIVFAKFDLLDKVKSKLTGNYYFDVAAILVLFLTFLLRMNAGERMDYLIVPVFIICSIIILSTPVFKYPKKLLIQIGKQSTNIWLIHSFYCYLWCQKFIFMPKYSILIFLLLLVVSYLSGIIIDLIYKLLYLIYKKLSKVELKHKVYE